MRHIFEGPHISFGVRQKVDGIHGHYASWCSRAGTIKVGRLVRSTDWSMHVCMHECMRVVVCLVLARRFGFGFGFVFGLEPESGR